MYNSIRCSSKFLSSIVDSEINHNWKLCTIVDIIRNEIWYEEAWDIEFFVRNVDEISSIIDNESESDEY